MANLMDILYSYAQDHEIEALLVQNDSYKESERCTRGQEARLRAMLDEAGINVLNEFLEEQKLLQLIEEETCFRAGFQAALELTLAR